MLTCGTLAIVEKMHFTHFDSVAFSSFFQTGKLNGKILVSHKLCSMHEAHETLYIGLDNGSLLCYDIKVTSRLVPNMSSIASDFLSGESCTC